MKKFTDYIKQDDLQETIADVKFDVYGKAFDTLVNFVNSKSKFGKEITDKVGKGAGKDLDEVNKMLERASQAFEEVRMEYTSITKGM